MQLAHALNLRARLRTMAHMDSSHPGSSTLAFAFASASARRTPRQQFAPVCLQIQRCLLQQSQQQ
jgi:hypothetical protein